MSGPPKLAAPRRRVRDRSGRVAVLAGGVVAVVCGLGGSPAGLAQVSDWTTPRMGPALPQAADHEVRLQQLERAVQRLTGRIERLDFRLDRIVNRLEALAGASVGGAPTDPRRPPRAEPAGPRADTGTVTRPGTGRDPFAEVPGAAAPTEPAAEPPAARPTRPAAGATTVRLPSGSDQDAYDYAFGLLRQADYDLAEQAFRTFLERHGASPLAANAQYWLAETHYVRGDYSAAAVAFAEGFQRFPDSSKTGDNLLKLGMSLAALDRGDDACVAFGQLAGGTQSGIAPSLRRRAEQERRRLRCR